MKDKAGKARELAIAPDLAAAITAMPATGADTFLVTEYGKAFSAADFGNRFRAWCHAADLRQCSAHGLRKAISRRMAEMGAGNPGIEAITGHSTASEVSHYARKADQMALGRSGKRITSSLDSG